MSQIWLPTEFCCKDKAVAGFCCLFMCCPCITWQIISETWCDCCRNAEHSHSGDYGFIQRHETDNHNKSN